MNFIKNMHMIVTSALYAVTKGLFKAKPIPPKKFRSIVWGEKVLQNVEIPNIIWTYWSGKPSACADACLASLKSSNKNFQIIDVNEKNLIDFLPELPTFHADLPLQSVSDFIRLSLLEKYGGIWIDRSVIVTCDLAWIINAAKKNNAEVICFYNENYKSYRKNHTKPIIETGFIASAKNSKFISDWLNNFKKCILSDNWKTYYANKDTYSQLISNFVAPPPNLTEYFSVYIAAQETMINHACYKLFLINAEDDYYFYYYKTQSPLNRINLAHWILMTSDEGSAPRLIKLPQRYREMTDMFISLGNINELSILGKSLKNQKKFTSRKNI